MFSEKDINQIQKRGADVSHIEQQIQYFRDGFPFMKLERAATIHDGIRRLTDEELQAYAAAFDSQSAKLKMLKFVPASGAASRMFKSLFAAKDEGKRDKLVDEFFEKLPQFAFYEALKDKTGKDGTDSEILANLLTDSGLDYGNLPKGLLQFHAYPDSIRTAVEEHLVEGALYANKKGTVRLHFTVSPEHRAKFKALLSEVVPAYEAQHGVTYKISFSEQKPSTDTIAVDMNNEPFRQADGSLLFRPAGHGALLENLNEQDADLIFIKNIDNVVPDHLKADTVLYKKALAGVLLDYQKQIRRFIRYLQKPDVSDYMVQKALRFLKNECNLELPKGHRSWSVADKKAFCLEKLNRPVRVCGMVKNVGEPGGGPFWAKNADGTTSLQVVESAQVNMNNAKQKEIFMNATHFNPVDLVVATRNAAKKPFDLLRFRDDNTGFITEKSMSGRALKAQELPGLWNGAMANWTTLFVEVPLSTFNPVKTVNDLLRPQHQPQA